MDEGGETNQFVEGGVAGRERVESLHDELHSARGYYTILTSKDFLRTC
jgi:hypothetical protein